MPDFEIQRLAAAARALNAHVETSVIDALVALDLAHEEVTTARRAAALLGQCTIECNLAPVCEDPARYTAGNIARLWPSRFTPETAKAYAGRGEDLANLVYGGRNGNAHPGDGFQYRGRGFIQLTGRGNYAAAGKALGIDLEQVPDRALEPPVAWRIACWFLRTAKSGARTAFEWADAGDWDGVSRAVNRWDSGSFARRHAASERAFALIADGPTLSV